MQSFKTHWRAITGGLATVYGLVRFILDAIGYVDLVVAHANSPTKTWLGRVMDILLGLPTWTVVPIVIGGLLLIWWDYKRNPRILHHHHVTGAAHGRAHVSGVSSVSIRPSERTPLLNLRDMAVNQGWPADNNPRTASSVWIKFTDSLRQAAFDGDVKLFGRESYGTSDEVVMSEPLKPIDSSHWEDFKFDTLSFLAAKTNLEIMSRNSKLVGWMRDADPFRDLHIDRANALQWLKTFPVPAEITPETIALSYEPDAWGVEVDLESAEPGRKIPSITIKNNCHALVTNCQLFVYVGHSDGSVTASKIAVSAPFNIRRDDRVHKELLRYQDGPTSDAAYLFFFEESGGNWHEFPMGIQLKPDVYVLHLSAFSDNAPVAMLSLKLEHIHGAWELTQAI